MEGLEVTKRVVDRLAELLEKRVEELKPLTLAEVAEVLREELCRVWDSVEPPPGFVKRDECSLEPVDVKGYLERLRDEIVKLANHLIDIAMEALAKHVETMDGNYYARLSWLLVSHSSRVAHRLTKLASMLGSANPSLVELSAILIALRALALYRLVSRLDSKRLEKLIENLEAFLAGAEGEEETLIDRLGEARVEP